MIWPLLQAGDPSLAQHTAQRIQEGDAFAAMAQFIWVIGVLALVQFGVWIAITAWIAKRLQDVADQVEAIWKQSQDG